MAVDGLLNLAGWILSSDDAIAAFRRTGRAFVIWTELLLPTKLLLIESF